MMLSLFLMASNIVIKAIEYSRRNIGQEFSNIEIQQFLVYVTLLQTFTVTISIIFR